MTPQPEPLNLPQMQAAAVRACALLKTLANPDRLLLLCQLTQAEYCVSELAAASGIAQPTLSQQLSVLREERLVTTRRDGKQIYYSLASDAASAVLQVLYQQFCAQPGGSDDRQLG
ncbi:metalloregulator ArsR/SmtB family transcription factor [Massilia sp. MP_M2]|uniref:ArsR/SmtB family transcription factor n=1 Tax=Massilia sp. MP_M2 TaxID=3071713 RepID=UPI00319E801F